MGAKIQAFDIFQTPLSSHYPLPLTTKGSGGHPVPGHMLSNTSLDMDMKSYKTDNFSLTATVNNLLIV